MQNTVFFSLITHSLIILGCISIFQKHTSLFPKNNLIAYFEINTSITKLKSKRTQNQENSHSKFRTLPSPETNNRIKINHAIIPLIENKSFSCIHCPKLIYPLRAYEKGYKGTVTLLIDIDSISGKIIQAKVEESSGFTLIDQAAIQNILTWVIKLSEMLDPNQQTILKGRIKFTC